MIGMSVTASHFGTCTTKQCHSVLVAVVLVILCSVEYALSTHLESGTLLMHSQVRIVDHHVSDKVSFVSEEIPTLSALVTLLFR